MTARRTIEVEKIQRLDIKPGETLVVTVPSTTTDQRLKEMGDLIRDAIPGIDVLFMSSAVKLSVVSSADAEKLTA